MTRLPRLKGKELVRLLGKLGFEIVRTRGSHFLLRHPDGRVTTVPVHSGETLGAGLLRSILRDIELSVEDLVEDRRGTKSVHPAEPAQYSPILRLQVK